MLSIIVTPISQMSELRHRNFESLIQGRMAGKSWKPVRTQAVCFLLCSMALHRLSFALLSGVFVSLSASGRASWHPVAGHCPARTPASLHHMSSKPCSSPLHLAPGRWWSALLWPLWSDSTKGPQCRCWMFTVTSLPVSGLACSVPSWSAGPGSAWDMSACSAVLPSRRP